MSNIALVSCIDTHAHLDGEEYAEDRREMIERARAAGVSKVFLPAIDLPSVDRVVAMSREFPDYCYPMIGLHPEEVRADYKEVLAKIHEKLSSSFSLNPQPSARLRQETLSKQSEERTLPPQIVINSGAKSERFMRQLYPELPEQAFIHYGNFIGETITIARELGVERLAMGVMIGKAVKLAEGKLDTHSHKTTMNIAFLKQMLAEAEVQKDIEGLNMARQLWSILTSEEMQRLEKIIIKHCHEHCDPLLPDGNIDIILISENVTK